MLEGLFGPVKQVTTTRQLIDNKQLSDLKVHGIVLTYPKEECIIRKYQDEIKYITQHPKRNNLIKNLRRSERKHARSFSLIKHGKELHNPDKKANMNPTWFTGLQIQKPENTLEDLQSPKQESLLSPVSVYSVLGQY